MRQTVAAEHELYGYLPGIRPGHAPAVVEPVRAASDDQNGCQSKARPREARGARSSSVVAPRTAHPVSIGIQIRL
jgi:hypothetical protein